MPHTALALPSPHLCFTLQPPIPALPTGGTCAEFRQGMFISLSWDDAGCFTTHTHARTHTHNHTHARMHTHHTHACTRAHTHTHTQHTRMLAHTHTTQHTRMHAHTHTSCTQHTRTHTHPHTHLTWGKTVTAQNWDLTLQPFDF